MAYQQQQEPRHTKRNGQNAENVMKAYGVPKPIVSGSDAKSKYG
jgi:hypothetical protein